MTKREKRFLDAKPEIIKALRCAKDTCEIMIKFQGYDGKNFALNTSRYKIIAALRKIRTGKI